MKHVLLTLIFCLLVVLNGSLVNAAEKGEEEAVLESISYEKDANNSETIIFKLNGTHIPKVFTIKGEKPRVVFDFIDTRYSDLINNIINTEGNLIKGVRVGIHNDPPKTRVVVDLSPEGEFEIKQDFQEQENILSITFYPDTQDPEAGKDKTAPVAATTPAGEENTSGLPAAEQSKESQAPAVNQQIAQSKPVELPSAVSEKKTVQAVTKQPVKSLIEKDDQPLPPASDRLAASDEVNAILAQMTEKKPAPADPILRDVSFETTANDSEMVLFKLNDFYPPIVFGIEKGTPRVVCDFLDTDLAEDVLPIIQTGGIYVSRIRTARHSSPEKVRVVLDLVPNRNYDLQQVFFKEDNLFVIIISEFAEEPVPSLAIPENPAISQ